MLACCIRNPSTEKGTDVLLRREEFRQPEMRDAGEKDLDVDLTYETLRINGDPSRVFKLTRYMGSLHVFEIWEGEDVRDHKKVMVKLMTKNTQNHEKSQRQEDAISAMSVYNLDCSGNGVSNMFGLFEQFPVRVGLNFLATKIWYIQDFPGGLTLSEFLVANYPHPKQHHISSGIPSEELIAKIMRQIIMGVNECHGAEVILRNICSNNLNISPSADILRIHDFWYCVEVPEDDHENCYKTTVWAGYPSYLAPESLLGSYYQTSDIWSCGVIAAELALGVNPFTAIAVDCLKDGISLHTAQKLRKNISDAALSLELQPKQYGKPWSAEFLGFIRVCD